MIITFTGKSCSGKSSLAKYLNLLDNMSTYISIDEIGHKVMTFEEIRKEVSKRLNIPLEELNRKNLADVVFNDPEKMEILTNITWGKMQEIIDDIIFQNSGKNIILDWALIPKSKYFEMADYNVLVNVPFEERLRRALERDNISKERFMERESASLDYNPSQFNIVIENTDFAKAKEEVLRFYEESIVPGKL